MLKPKAKINGYQLKAMKELGTALSGTHQSPSLSSPNVNDTEVLETHTSSRERLPPQRLAPDYLCSISNSYTVVFFFKII